MRFKVSTKGFNDIIDITGQVSEAVEKSKVKEGSESGKNHRQREE